jgi:Na+-driven multidrug efflux pump
VPASRPSANRKILAIAVPVALSSQVDTLVGMADIFIVSRLREASATAKQAFTLVAMITGSLSIVGWFGAHLCLEAMSLAPAVVELGTAYLRIYFAGMVVLSLNYAVSTCFYGMGDARTPLYVNIAASLIKVGATYVLVLGPFGLSAWLCALSVVQLARPFMELFTDVPEVIGIGVIYL